METTSRAATGDPVAALAQSLATKWQSGYQLRADGGWWHFEPVTAARARRQGWKLHVSAVPVNAAETLRRVAAVILPYGLQWKVARSARQLAKLCGPPTPLPQVGKFITIYLDDDARLPAVAEAVHEATRLLDGPVVPTDYRYRRGSNVYLRYGAFSSCTSYRGAEQVRTSYLVGPDGRLEPDQRLPGRYRPEWVAPPAVPGPGKRLTPARGAGGLFGRGIVVSQALRQSAKGGVYQARWCDRDVVVKEARAGTCPDLLGRDSRWRLRNEWTILRHLAGSGLAPEPLDFFLADGNAYLVQEYLPGVTLRGFVESGNYSGRPTAQQLRRSCQRLIALAAALRSRGVVLRDFSPNNVMVVGDRYVAIDLELCELASSPEPPYEGWTPGYARLRGGEPDATDQEYAVAAIVHFILTGVDPYLGGSVDVAGHVDSLLAEFGPTEAEVVATESRRVRAALAGETAGTCRGGPAAADVSVADVLAEAEEAGQELVRRVEWDRAAWPWPAKWAPAVFHPACFHSGAAGIAQYYLDLWHATRDRQWLRHAGDLLEWILINHPYLPGQSPPGLHFGLASVPWLLAELGRCLGEARGAQLRLRAGELACSLSRAAVTSWDVTHGWAGIGLAGLAVLRRGDNEPLRAVVAQIIDRVRQGAVTHEGMTMWPGRNGPSYGFAHGCAGIGYLLLRAGQWLGDESAKATGLLVAQGLLNAAVTVAGGEGFSWRHTAQAGGACWTHWCNGSAGVGGFLLAAWRASGERGFLDAAARAGRAITLGRPYGSCCRCHGLAGDGDYLLDLADEPELADEFRQGAGRIGRKLEALKVRQGFGWKWPQEGGGEPRPSYMRGYPGVHAFRLRLAGLITHTPLMITDDLGGCHGGDGTGTPGWRCHGDRVSGRR